MLLMSRYKQRRALCLLLAHGADVSALNDSQVSAMSLAMRSRDLVCCALLAFAGAPVSPVVLASPGGATSRVRLRGPPRG